MTSTASEDEIPAFVSETPAWRGRQLDSFHPDFGNDSSVMEVLDAIPDGFPVNSGQWPLVRSSFRLAPRSLPSGIECTDYRIGTPGVLLSNAELDQERFKEELASLCQAQRSDGDRNPLVSACIFEPNDNDADSNVVMREDDTYRTTVTLLEWVIDEALLLVKCCAVYESQRTGYPYIGADAE